MTTERPNQGSPLLERARDNRHISFVDVDGTIAGYAERPSKQEIEARREIREILDNQGGLVLSTMRTPELCMSEKTFKASRDAGFCRGEPHCHVDESKRRAYQPLNTLLKYIHNLDPHCISNPGTGVWVYKGDSYHHDHSLFVRHQKINGQWRADVEKLLEVVDTDRAIRDTFSKLECPENYRNGDTDVQTLSYRFELTYKRAEDAPKWREFVRERLHSLRGTKHPLASVANTIEIVDESVPMRGHYQLYLLPRRLTKEGAANHILNSISLESGIPTREFTTVTFGDRMPDLKAGLVGGYDTRGFFVLAGGSPLAEYLIGNKRGQDYAGQSLKSIVRRLKPICGRKGFYTFFVYGMPCPRVIAILDEAFPHKTDAESIYEFLKLIRQW